MLSDEQENMIIDIIEDYIKKNHKFPSRPIIRGLVLPKFNNVEGLEEFCASKGWFDKMEKRNFKKIVELKTLAKSYTESSKASSRFGNNDSLFSLDDESYDMVKLRVQDFGRFKKGKDTVISKEEI